MSPELDKNISSVPRPSKIAIIPAVGLILYVIINYACYFLTDDPNLQTVDQIIFLHMQSFTTVLLAIGLLMSSRAISLFAILLDIIRVIIYVLVYKSFINIFAIIPYCLLAMLIVFTFKNKKGILILYILPTLLIMFLRFIDVLLSIVQFVTLYVEGYSKIYLITIAASMLFKICEALYFIMISRWLRKVANYNENNA